MEVRLKTLTIYFSWLLRIPHALRRCSICFYHIAVPGFDAKIIFDGFNKS